MFVSARPGAIALTVTPIAAHSRARPIVSATTPALETPYNMLPITPPPRIADTEAILTMRPQRWHAITETAAREAWTTEATFSRETSSQSDGLDSRTDQTLRIPALLMRI